MGCFDAFFPFRVKLGNTMSEISQYKQIVNQLIEQISLTIKFKCGIICLYINLRRFERKFEMKAITKLFFILSLIFEVVAVLFGGCLTITSIYMKETDFFLLFLSFLIIPVLWMIISIVSLKKARKGHKTIIPLMILIKMTVLLILFGISFLTIDDGIYSFYLFGSLGLFTGIVSVLLIKFKDNKMDIPPIYNSFREYNAGDYWVFAASEYLRLNYREMTDLALKIGILYKPVTVKNYMNLKYVGLSDTDKENITKYACNPIIYFLKWLIENEHMSDYFYAKHSAEDIEQMKNETISISEFFADKMNYIVSPKDINSDIDGFMRNYYEPFLKAGLYTRASGTYFFDYVKVIKKYSDYFYCYNYSYDIYRELRAIFDKRYSEYTESLLGNDYYHSDYVVHWKLFNANLEVRTDCDKSQIIRCEEALNSIDEKQLKKLERMAKKEFNIKENFDFFKTFKPDLIDVHTPKDNDVYFRVKASDSQFSFSVRNGIVGYQKFIPYSQKDNEQYILDKSSIDFLSLTNQNAVDELCNMGKLKAVGLELDGMELKSKESTLDKTIYIPPEAEPVFYEIIERLSIMGAHGLISDVKIGTLSHENCIIPQSIRFVGITNFNGKQNFRFIDEINIWN